MTKKMTALIIMDGFGERAETYGNAIKLAGTPNLDKLEAEYPHTVIGASGMDVGLPDGQMGNSEVGHTQHWRGPHCLSGADPHHQVHSGRRFLQDSRICGCLRRRPRRTAASCT